LDRRDVLATIQEILIDLVGCKEFILFEIENCSVLSPLAWYGVAPDDYRGIELGSGVIGQTAADGQQRIAGDQTERTPEEQHLTACIPLKFDGKVTGVIAIFRLLDHKIELDAADHDLFALLGTHAATALYCSALRAAGAVGVA
jgi:hypothetical protein